MTEIETWLGNASRDLSVSIRQLPAQEAAAVYAGAQARYVAGSPRVWWLALTKPCTEYDSSTTSLTEVLPTREGGVFLIPEQEARHAVFEIEATHLESILSACPYFEYYVVDPKLRWLVAESDHNVFFVCQDSSDH